MSALRYAQQEKPFTEQHVYSNEAEQQIIRKK